MHTWEILITWYRKTGLAPSVAWGIPQQDFSREPGSFHPRILSTHLASNLRSSNPCLWRRCEGVPHYRTGHSARAWLLDPGGAGDCMDLQALHRSICQFPESSSREEGTWAPSCKESDPVLIEDGFVSQLGLFTLWESSLVAHQP